MTRDSVLEIIIKICKDVFENEHLTITDSTSANDIDEWDSLAHLSLVTEIMKAFSVQLTLDDINTCTNIGELADAVIKRLK